MMDQPRLFRVAPDVVHLRATYEHLTATWKLHVGVVERLDDGEQHNRPVETYELLTNEELLDVAWASLAMVVGVED